MKTAILAVGTLSLCLVGWAAPNDLDDAYQQLKDAQSAKDADAVKKWATQTAKLAKAEAAGPKLDNYSDEEWPKRVDYDKQVGTLCEYAVATTAAQPGLDPAKVVEMGDALLAMNPKSAYLGVASNAYLTALAKIGGADKQTEGATKIVAGSPNDEEALMILADNLMAKNRPDQAYSYASRLVTVMKSK